MPGLQLAKFRGGIFTEIRFCLSLVDVAWASCVKCDAISCQLFGAVGGRCEKDPFFGLFNNTLSMGFHVALSTFSMINVEGFWAILGGTCIVNAVGGESSCESGKVAKKSHRT